MLLKLPAVMNETALGRSSIYAMVAAGRFPSPVRIGMRGVAWRSEDIDAWKEALTPSLKAKPVEEGASA